LPDPEAVPHASVNVYLCRHAGPLERQIELRKTLRNVLPIIFTADEKSGRRILRECQVARDGGIEQSLERRLRTLALHRIGCSRDTSVVLRAGERGQFAAGGKTHNPDVPRLQPPFGGAWLLTSRMARLMSGNALPSTV
jgi:hypothetical protein